MHTYAYVQKKKLKNRLQCQLLHWILFNCESRIAEELLP